MQCINCNQHTKQQQRDANGSGYCLFCGHLFVCEPSRDGMTDRHFQKIEASVTANGRYFFLRNQLGYQVRSTVNHELGRNLSACYVWFISFLLSLVFIKSGGHLLLVSLFAVIALLVTVTSRTKHKKALGRLDDMVSNWVKINPHEKLLTEEKYPGSIHNFSLKKEFADIHFDRVLILENNDMVDFFLANLFHFHQVCPILGGNDYPKAICKDMLQHLKKNPDLQVFLLHDYSTEGLAFVNSIKTDPAWFGGSSEFTFIDLGLLGTQKPLFRSLTKKLTGRDNRSREIAELSLLKPECLLKMCAQAINEAVPLHRLSDKGFSHNCNRGALKRQ